MFVPMAARRRFLKSLAAIGVGPVVFQRALAAQAETSASVTVEMIQQAEWISGITLTEADRKSLLEAMNRQQGNLKALRKFDTPNDVAPALVFNPSPGLPSVSPTAFAPIEPMAGSEVRKPSSADDLAFLSVAALSKLLRSRQVSSMELTRLYLERLHKHDATLKCVVTFTDDLALKQAEQADREIAAGRYRGPLHGIPWGAKDLIAYPGYKTTWGAGPTKEQTIDVKATVARKLDEAGAVLIAKLTLGALAMGDQWFGGKTRNPWNPEEGSSGSSAGSASSVAAGLVGFAIGSETLGSIVSPCTRCGATGLRPTFGRVSRHGCMALSWSMDKLGPIARTVEDCALVFGAIHGADGLDACAVDRPFTWPPRRELKALKVGFVEGTKPPAALKDLGVQLVPIKLPTREFPLQAMLLILTAESAAAFDDLTRKGVSEGIGEWPGSFRRGQFIPAVEYIRANRIRSLAMKAMNKVMEQVDLYVAGNDLTLTNLTGHPTVVLPNGMRKQRDAKVETPTAITFTGRLNGETELLAVAKAYQDATGHHLKRPAIG